MAKDKLMTITKSVDPEKLLTILVASGELSFKKIMASLKSFYEDQPTKNLLWNFRNAKMTSITSGHIEVITSYVEQHGHKRSGGKSAWVVSRDLEFGMMRITETLALVKKIPFQIKLFRSLDKAEQWLEEDE
jgi:hypothetical protein